MLTELENAISEQFTFISSETLGGNIVKLEFHKGALFGLRLAERLIEEARKDNLAIALMNKLDKLVEMGRHILVAEEILVDTVNEWRSAEEENK